MVEVAETLKAVDIFKDLNDADRQKIEARCTWHSYPPGVHVIDRNSNAMDVYFVTRGMVRAVIYSEGGREISLEDIDTGAHFGELSALDSQPRSANVVTVYSTTVAVMPRDTFLKVLEEFPIVALALLRRMADMVRSSTNRIMDLSILSAQGRVYSDLRKLAEKRYNDSGQWRISPIPVHSDIASRVSTTRETVARVIGDLTRKKILKKERNVLIITDIDALDALMTL